MRDNKLDPEIAQQLTLHVRRLCNDHCIDLRIMDGCKVYAYPTIHRVHIIPIVYTEDYCIALHEIGHVVLCHRPEQPRGWKELAAWAWAKANALFWYDDMEEHAAWCLGCWGIHDLDPSQFIQPQSLL